MFCGKRNDDRRYGLGDVEYLVNTYGDDSLLACPAVRRFRLLQLLVLYSEKLVVATLVDVLLTDAHDASFLRRSHYAQ